MHWPYVGDLMGDKVTSHFVVAPVHIVDSLAAVHIAWTHILPLQVLNGCTLQSVEVLSQVAVEGAMHVPNVADLVGKAVTSQVVFVLFVEQS